MIPNDFDTVDEETVDEETEDSLFELQDKQNIPDDKGRIPSVPLQSLLFGDDFHKKSVLVEKYGNYKNKISSYRPSEYALANHCDMVMTLFKHEMGKCLSNEFDTAIRKEILRLYDIVNTCYKLESREVTHKYDHFVNIN